MQLKNLKKDSEKDGNAVEKDLIDGNNQNYHMNNLLILDSSRQNSMKNNTIIRNHTKDPMAMAMAQNQNQNHQISTGTDDNHCQICLESCQISKIQWNDMNQCPRCCKSWHSECINKWLEVSRTCPNCRCPIPQAGLQLMIIV